MWLHKCLEGRPEIQVNAIYAFLIRISKDHHPHKSIMATTVLRLLRDGQVVVYQEIDHLIIDALEECKIPHMRESVSFGDAVNTKFTV